MHKVRKEYSNYISDAFEQATYRTKFPINDMELFSSFKFKGFSKEIADKLFSMDLELNMTEEEFLPVRKHLLKYGMDIELPETFQERMYAAFMFTNTLPQGIKSGDSIMYTGLSSLGKTTMAIQEGGNMIRPYMNELTSKGEPRAKFIYYCTEGNATNKARLKQLLNFNDEQYDTHVEAYSIADGASISHLTKLVLDISAEKLGNPNDYAVKTITTEGDEKYYLAPTIIALDSLSDLVADKRYNKIIKEFEKGKDGSKESDQMQELQAKSTMFTNKIIKNNANKANIIIIYIGHLGDDGGVEINSYQKIRIQDTLNNKSYYKMKGIPKIAKFSMSYTKVMDSLNSKADDLNADYGFDEAHKLKPMIQYLVNVSIEKNRSSGVSKGKTIPYVFNPAGEFDPIMSMIYYYKNVMGMFKFGDSIPGVVDDNMNPIKISKGKVFFENVYQNPLALMIIRNHIFSVNYMDKMYEKPLADKMRKMTSELF